MYWPLRKLPFSVYATSTASTYLFTEHLVSSPVNLSFDFLKKYNLFLEWIVVVNWLKSLWLYFNVNIFSETFDAMQTTVIVFKRLKRSRVRLIYIWFPYYFIGNYWFIVHICHNCEETLFSLSSFIFLVTLCNVLCKDRVLFFCMYLVCSYMFIVNLYVVLLNTF